MTTRGRRQCYASVVAILAVLLVACGQDDPGQGAAQSDAAARSHGAQTRTPSPTGGTDPGATEPDATATGTPAPTPDEVAEEPAPTSTYDGRYDIVTGSLTEEQEEFLDQKDLAGNDPAAIVEAGEESCDRLRYAKSVDPDAAISAIIVGQVVDADDAITHLCPELAPELALATQGFADGVFGVAADPVAGESIRPGQYRALQPSPTCAWSVADASGNLLDQAAAEAPGASGSADLEMTIATDAASVTSDGCFAWVPVG